MFCLLEAFCFHLDNLHITPVIELDVVRHLAIDPQLIHFRGRLDGIFLEVAETTELVSVPRVHEILAVIVMETTSIAVLPQLVIDGESLKGLLNGIASNHAVAIAALDLANRETSRCLRHVVFLLIGLTE